MTASEKYVQARIRDLLACRGIETKKMHGTALNVGWPDVFAGRFWIEVKAPGKKLRPSQVDWFETFVDRMGAVAYVCDDHRKLWSIIGDGTGMGKLGVRPSNWRDFAPKVHHKVRLSSALSDWATPPGKG